MITQAQEDLREPVDNHASAVKEIMSIWITWLRQLDEPVLIAAAPGYRLTDKSRRGLIEMDPADLTESIFVRQDPNTASDRVVLQQAGLELRATGVIDDRKYFEEYALESDPDEAELRMYVQQVKTHVIGGIPAQPGSLIALVVDAVKGNVFYEALKQSPNMALAVAEQMAQAAQEVAQPQGAAPPGNIAGAMGIRQDGQGMGLTLPGSPTGGLSNVVPQTQ